MLDSAPVVHIATHGSVTGVKYVRMAGFIEINWHG